MAENKRVTSYSLTEEEIPSGTMPSPELAERRKALRTHLEIDLTITFDGHELQGMTHDISRTGVFVSTYRVLPLGSVVQLKFALPSGTVIAHGVVSRVRRSSDGITSGMGVAFGGLDELDRGLIESYCAEEPSPRTSDIRISRPQSR
ncbi:MAG: PilZ domain-containing protein [Polyangiaceae bacterium]